MRFAPEPVGGERLLYSASGPKGHEVERRRFT
jgi:hypothetical protein